MLDLVLDTFLVVLSALSVLSVSSSLPSKEETSEFVEYIPGNINLIISIPHDGDKKPEYIQDRRNGCRINGVCNFDEDFKQCASVCKAILYGDLNCSVIGVKMVDEYKRITGNSPHVLIARLHRSKVDMNRNSVEGVQGDEGGLVIYQEYHNILMKLRNQIKGPGLIIDLHGMTHHQNSSELGYLYLPEELNARNYSRNSSVRSLMEREKLSPEDMLFGNESLGALFDEEGYKAIPSPRQPSPGTDLYYRGGYITQQYGSSEEGEVDAIQIEVPSEIRFENGDEPMEKFSLALARILYKFFETYY